MKIKTDAVDVYVDVTYGMLLMIGAGVMIGYQEYLPAVTFGVGVILSYSVHIAFRMARFDPDTTDKIEETVEKTVEETVGESVSEVDERVESVEESVESVESDVEKIVENEHS